MVDSIDKEVVATFCMLLRARLLDASRQFSEEYLQMQVKEVVVVLNGDSVRIKGGYVWLAGAIKFAAQKKKLSTRMKYSIPIVEGVPEMMEMRTGKFP